MNNFKELLPISNPGISFTDDMDKKILSMKDLLENTSEKRNYMGLQELLISNGIFSGSYCRSFLPFLYNCGFTIEYDGEFNCDEYFTKYGDSYINVLKSIFELELDSNDSRKTEILKNLTEARSGMLKLALINMKKKKYIHFGLYKTFLDFICKYETINKEEFYINQYYIQNNSTVPENIIKDYRNGSISFRQLIGKEPAELLSNPYTFCKSFLAEEQCDLIIKKLDGNYEINKSEIDFVKEIIS